MTDENSTDPTVPAGNDHEPYPFGYGHGRMPFFMKIVWVVLIVFMTWYIVTFLLTSIGAELGK
jgi:hypothetical protein